MTVIDIMGVVEARSSVMPRLDASSRHRKNTQNAVVEVLAGAGWQVVAVPHVEGRQPGLYVQRGTKRLLVVVKSITEGRVDRVIPLLSQAILEAQAAAKVMVHGHPVAVIALEKASESLSRQVESFVERYAPDVAVGLVCANGFRYFRGGGLEVLNAEPQVQRGYEVASMQPPVNLFSDLNQWMLKVLLANEIPRHLLSAPRQRYRSGAEFAKAADVSPMSASRFLHQLRNEGYLEESGRSLTLVRRADLFRRWRSVAIRPSAELPMKFLVRSPVATQIKALLTQLEGQACLGLFAAAEELELGHVSGVPPYIYVSKLPHPEAKEWQTLMPAGLSEKPDVIVRQATLPQSIFRGAVQKDGWLVSDVIQVWLDVGSHPSRGEEQAHLIYDKVLSAVEEKGN